MNLSAHNLAPAKPWVTSLCGSSAPFRVWDPDADDFGVCFTQVVFTIPTHTLLAAVSAYFAGALSGPKLDSARLDPSRSLLIRLFCCLLLFVLSFVLFFIPYAFSSSPSFLVSSTRASSSSFDHRPSSWNVSNRSGSGVDLPRSSAYVHDVLIPRSTNIPSSPTSAPSSDAPRPFSPTSSTLHSSSPPALSSSPPFSSPTPSRLVPPLFSPSPADICVIIVVAGSWLLHCLALWRRRVRANVVRLKTLADVIMGLTYLTILVPQSILARRAILRLASHASAGGSPFRFDDADAAVFIVHLIICLAHLLYASSLIVSSLIKCVQRMQHTDDLSDLNPLINSDLSVRIVTPSSASSRRTEDGATFISKLFFSWVNPLLRSGSQGDIDDVSSLYVLPKSISVENLFSDLKSRLTNLASVPRTSSPSSSSYVEFPRVQGRLRQRPSSSEEPATSDRVSLGRALLNMFGTLYFSCGLLKLLSDCLAFFGPILLHALIVFASSSSSSTSSSSSRGWLIAAGLVGSAAACAFLGTQFGFAIGKIQLRMRVALVHLIYERALKWTTSSLASSQLSAGEIVNAMSTDVDRLVNFCNSFHACWSLPFQIAVSLFLLHREIGLAFLAGLAFALLLIPINKVLCSRIMHFSTAMMAAKDKRIKLMTEILQGVKSLKFSAVENFFARRIALHRGEELKNLKGVKYLDAMCVFFWATTPVMITLLSFLAYCFIYSSSSLNAAKIFTSLALFNMLIGPLNAMPWVINGLVDAWVSLKRLEKLIEISVDGFDDSGNIVHKGDEETGAAVHRLRVPPMGSSLNSIASLRPPVPILEMRSATFEWTAKEDEFKLVDISLSVLQGQIIGVVGAVGSGKSALLLSMIGDLRLTSGSVYRCWNRKDEDGANDYGGQFRPGVGYVGQEAWLLQGSVRDNVLFGAPFEVEWYDAVLDACCLRDDIDAMPDKDATQVGEKGFALSGGQKQRIALARAVYAKKRLYVLDCPFSALDKTVRSHIWRECILGLLLKRTRQVPVPSPSPRAPRAANAASSPFSSPIESRAFADLVETSSDSLPVTVVISSHYGEELFVDPNTDADFRSSSSPSSSSVDWVLKLEEGRLTARGPPRDVLGTNAWKDSVTPEKDRGDESRRSNEDDSPSAENAVASPVETEEFKASGAVAASVYSSYVAAAGRLLSAAILVSLLFMQASRNVSDWWLSYWVLHFSSQPDANVTLSSNAPKHASMSTSSSSAPSSSDCWRLGPMLASGGFLSFFPAESHSRRSDLSFSSASPSPSLSSAPSPSSSASPSSISFPTSGVACLLAVYSIIAAFNFIVTFARSFLFALGGINAAQTLHQRLVRQLLKAPLSFFSSTPAGRILNRFSSDLYTVDSSLPFILNIFLAQVFGVAGVIVVVCASLPLFLLVLIPLAVFYHRVQYYYRHTSREVKRLTSVTLSPIYAHFTSSLEGAPVIRTMGECARFLRTNLAHVETNARAQYAQLIVSQWLNFNLQAIGVGVMFGASLAALLERKFFQKDNYLASPALVGLAISYVLSVQDRLSGVVSSFTETEKEMISVERVTDYIERIPVEEEEEEEEEENENRYAAPTEGGGGRAGILRGTGTPNHGRTSRTVASSPVFPWPSAGEIVFEDATLVYASSVGGGDRDLGESVTMMKALDGVSLSIGGGEKILVVGRTGSGKSSLLTALLRLHPLAGGRVLIDGVDVRHVPIEMLRRGIAVIPQDPLLFTGSVRQNLLPTDAADDDRLATQSVADDEDIRRLLVGCRLQEVVDSLGGLDAEMQPAAFSLGQKQLFAAARAILRRCRVLCLDEATAHLDSETDSLLQGAISHYAADATVICISHRRGADLNADKTLVMSCGKVEAFG